MGEMGATGGEGEGIMTDEEQIKKLMDECDKLPDEPCTCEKWKRLVLELVARNKKLNDFILEVDKRLKGA